MAVKRLTDYTRRIWTALDADAPEDHDIQVNDVIYYMDSSQCGIVTYVYPDGSIDVEFLPDVGGGGIPGDDIYDQTIIVKNTGTGYKFITTMWYAEDTDLYPLHRYRIAGGSTATAHTFVHNGSIVGWSEGHLSDITYNGTTVHPVFGTWNGNIGHTFKMPLPADFDPTIPFNLIYI